jgi:hypothetical protein
MKLPVLMCVSLLAGLLAGCDQSDPAPATPTTTDSYGTAPSPPATTAPPTTGAPAAPPSPQENLSRPDDPTKATFLGLEAPKPATWQWQPPRNAMITTNYTVPGVGESRAAHLNVYFFGEGMGGPISDNIERWKNQFRSPDGYEVEPTIEEFEVDSMPVTYVELAGEWMQMGAAWYTRDQLFLAAIVDAPAGRIFIRFAGDDRTVEHNREPFMEMIHGLRRVDGAQVDDPGAPYDNTPSY